MRTGGNRRSELTDKRPAVAASPSANSTIENGPTSDIELRVESHIGSTRPAVAASPFANSTIENVVLTASCTSQLRRLERTGDIQKVWHWGSHWLPLLAADKQTAQAQTQTDIKSIGSKPANMHYNLHPNSASHESTDQTKTNTLKTPTKAVRGS